MVKSFAYKIDGPWLQSQAATAIQNASYRFNVESDPFFQKAAQDSHKTEAQRRAEQTESGSGETGGRTQSRKTQSKPEPILKPRSQQGRASQEPWLAAQYQQAVRNTRTTDQKPSYQNDAPQQRRGQSPSR